MPVSIWKGPHGSALRAFDSVLRAAAPPGPGRADIGCGQVGLKQQNARDGRQHELLPAGAVIRQRRDAQEGRELAPENALDCLRAAVGEAGKLIRRDERGAQRQDLDRVGRDGGVDDINLVAHDQPEREQHDRHGRAHDRAGRRLGIAGGEHLTRERRAGRDRQHGQDPLQPRRRERAAAKQQPQAADCQQCAEHDAADGAHTRRRGKRGRKRIRKIRMRLVFHPKAHHGQHDRCDDDHQRDGVRPDAAAHGKAGVGLKTDLILQPAEKGPERCQHSRAAADYPSIFAHNKLPVPIHIE